MRVLLGAAVLCIVASAANGAIIGKVTVTTEQAPVMQGKETVLIAKKGDVFDVSEIKGDWYSVLPSRGWIHKANVRYEPGTSPASPSLADVVWARIILDEEFFPKGATWVAAESAYRALQQFGIPGPPSPGIVNVLALGAGIEYTRVTPASLTARYGPGRTERTEQATGGRDAGVTYHMYGLLGFGIAPGEKGFSWLKADERLFKAGFVKAAKDALAAAPRWAVIILESGLVPKEVRMDFRGPFQQPIGPGVWWILLPQTDFVPVQIKAIIDLVGPADTTEDAGGADGVKYQRHQYGPLKLTVNTATGKVDAVDVPALLCQKGLRAASEEALKQRRAREGGQPAPEPKVQDSAENVVKSFMQCLTQDRPRDAARLVVGGRLSVDHLTYLVMAKHFREGKFSLRVNSDAAGKPESVILCIKDLALCGSRC